MGAWDNVGLWDWFANNFIPLLRIIFREAFSWFLEVATFFRNALTNVYTLVVGWVVLSYWAIQKIGATIDALSFASVQGPTAAMLQYYAFINRFVPLSESLAGAVAVFNIWLVVTVVRWVKSFIPTISN